MNTETSRPSKWLEWGAGELAFLGEAEARQECERMLETLLGVSRFELYFDTEPDPSFFPPFQEWVEARKKRVPLAYLLGQADFWTNSYEVDKRVLIPRPETEVLIEALLRNAADSSGEPIRFLDLGTGSGNIAVTVSKALPRAAGVASDLSEGALTLASRNAKRLDVQDRLEFVQGDGLLPFRKNSFDLILSNPPYVASGEWAGLEPEVRGEPRLALDGGKDGLDFYRRIFQELFCLEAGGSLWLEVGAGQAGEVSSFFKKNGFQRVQVFRDLDQIERVVAGIGFRG